MARKRGPKKNRARSRRKQPRQSDSVPDVPATDSAEPEQPLLQGRSREEHSATAHWTSPDTIPVEPAKYSGGNMKSTDNQFKSPGATFFSPPAPDFASMKSPEARPINTPYSSRKQPLSDSYYSDSDYTPSSASEASPDRASNASTSSASNTPRYSSRSGLRDQVRDLDNLLTSPLTVHLGKLADGGTPKRTLGPMRDSGEDDDMSEEWDQLAQSEHLLRKELASFDMEPLTSSKDNAQESEFLSIPPGIARQRLDPLASPIHPYNLFPKKNDETPERNASLDTPAYSPMNKEEKKEDSPSKKPNAARTTRAYVSPPRPPSRQGNESMQDTPASSSFVQGQNSHRSVLPRMKIPQGEELGVRGTSSRKKNVTNFESSQRTQEATGNAAMTPLDKDATIYKSPRTRSSKSSNFNNKTRDETKYHTAIYASSISHDSSTQQLSDEMDQLVNSMPLFGSTDDFSEFNNLSALSDQSKNTSHQSTGSEFVDAELSQLVHSVQEQLDASTGPETPTKKTKKRKKRRTVVSITQSKTPDLSEGTIQVVEPDEESHASDYSTGKQPHDEAANGNYSDNEDDGMSTELNELEKSEILMRAALATSYDDYALPSKPTPNSPPQLTDDLIQNGSHQEMSLIQPVPVVPSSRSHSKDKAKLPETFRSVTPPPTASVTTMGGATMTNQGSPGYSGPLGAKSSTGKATNTQAGVAGLSSSSDKPLSSTFYPSPVSNDESEDVVLKVSDFFSSTKGIDSFQMKQHPATTENKKTKKPPPILTPEQVEQMHELHSKHSCPTPPSAVPSTRSQHFCGSNSTPTRLLKQPDQASTPARNSTPDSQRSRGSAVKTLFVAPCAALEHLVRTPSPADKEGRIAAERPFQFVEGGDDTSDSSQSIVPFTPDELNELNYRPTKYAQLYLTPNAETIAKGTVSWEKEFEIESSRQEMGDIEMSEMMKSEGQQSQPSYWMAYRYDRKQNTRGDASDSETNGKSGEIPDLLLNSQTRMKQIEQERREIEIYHQEQKRGGIEMKQIKKKEKGQLSQNFKGYHSDSEVLSFSDLSPAARRRQLKQSKNPLSVSMKELNPITTSPATKRRSQSLSHRTQTSPSKKEDPCAPTSTESADTWKIESRADGGKSLSTLDTILSELSEYRPKRPRLQQLSPSKNSSASPHRRSYIEPSHRIETPLRVYMNTRSKSHSSDEDDKNLLFDVENPDSNKKDGDETAGKPYSGRKRGMFYAAIFLIWLIVMGIVIALALLIVRGRDDSQQSTDLVGEASPSTNKTTIAPTTSPMWIDTEFPSPTTSLPIALSPTSETTAEPTETLPGLRPVPVTPPATPRPTGSLRPVSNSTLSLISLLVSRSVDVGQALLDRSSPEYAALQWLAGNPLLDSYSDQQKVQRFVLATVYYSLNGDEWTLNSRWLSDWDECRWFSRARRFPVCNSDGNYVSLELGYVDATGTLPKALGMLSNSLERIDIQGGPRAFLTGTLPSELGLLTLMREFRVSNNELGGRVDLHRWSFLEDLDLSGNQFTGPLPFTAGNWSYASVIDLEENFFQGTLPTEIGHNKKLIELKIGDNLLSGPVPSQISRLTDLEELMLEQNNFDSFPSEIGQLYKLTSLMLYTNRIAASIPSEIGALTELRSFSAAFNFLRGTIPSEVGMLTEIRDRFDLSYNALTSVIPSEIGHLKKMRHLLLNSNQLTGSVPQEVSALDRLNTFRIDANDIDGGISAEICEVFNITLPYFYADCSELDCPCCLFCCEDSRGCACRYENTVDQYLCY